MLGNKILAVAVVLLAVVNLSTQSAEEHLRFIHYPNGREYTVQTLPTILNETSFSKTKITVFFFHGFLNSPRTSEVVDIRNAYVSRSAKYNFIVVFIDSLYYTSFAAASSGRAVASGINALIAANTATDSSNLPIEIVGFSLGAQIGALASRVVGASKIERLIGLDPGRFVVEQRLSRADAKFVVTVHSETKLYGDPKSLGHVNFWINGAISQPENRLCSHKQAEIAWARAIFETRPAYSARLCDSYQSFLAGACNVNEIASLNRLDEFPVPIAGDYYFQTTRSYPYSNVLRL